MAEVGGSCVSVMEERFAACRQHNCRRYPLSSFFLFSVSFNGLNGIECWILAGDSNQEGMSVHYCCQDIKRFW